MPPSPTVKARRFRPLTSRLQMAEGARMIRKGWIALTALLCLSPLAGGAEPVQFQPVDLPDHRYTGGWEHFVGGGLAAFDCDGDHLPDLVAAGGAGPSILLRNRSIPGGALRFDPDTPKALTTPGITGAYALDIDSDGVSDLVLMRVGENQLLRGDGDCGFEPFTSLGFRSEPRWTTAFSATWEPGQSLPTLAFGNYVDRDDPNGPFRSCDDNSLYRPDGARYGPPLPLSPGYCALSMLFSDWDRRGQPDLRISNDRHYYVDDGAEQLWHLSPTPRLYTEAGGWRRHRLWGMGIASRDLDGDGLPEVLLSSMGDQRLQARLPGTDGPAYGDLPYETGTTAHRPYTGGDGRPSTGWHVAFGDVQNDGLDDIFIAKGNVDQMADAAMIDPNNLLLGLPDGRYVETGDSAGVASLHRGRGAALTDLNRDGRLDLAVVNRRAPLEIWQNVSPATGNWLQIDLSQPGPNRGAIGAWIELSTGARTHARERTIGGGHAGGTTGPEHFGLGPATEARLRVIWPDGLTSDWLTVTANQNLTLHRTKGTTILRPAP